MYFFFPNTSIIGSVYKLVFYVLIHLVSDFFQILKSACLINNLFLYYCSVGTALLEMQMRATKSND